VERAEGASEELEFELLDAEVRKVKVEQEPISAEDA